MYSCTPVLPQEIGIIEGFAEYPAENLMDPYSRSVIRLRTVTTDMTGEYTCAISTFQDEASNSSKMIVYGKLMKKFTLKINPDLILKFDYSFYFSLSAGKWHDGAHLPLQQDACKFYMHGHGCSTAAIPEALHRRDREQRSRERSGVFNGLV